MSQALTSIGRIDVPAREGTAKALWRWLGLQKSGSGRRGRFPRLGVALRLGWHAYRALSRRLDCAESNSSFTGLTPPQYAKWRESTTPGFRFA